MNSGKEARFCHPSLHFTTNSFFYPESISIFHNSTSHSSISFTFNFSHHPFILCPFPEPHLPASLCFTASSSLLLTFTHPPHFSFPHPVCHPSLPPPCCASLCLFLVPPLSLSHFLSLHCLCMIAHPSHELLCHEYLKGYSRLCQWDV